MKLLKAFFILSLALFPFGELLRFNVSENIFIRPLDVIVGLTALLWLLLRIKEKKNLSIKKNWYFFLFPAVAFISLLINSTWLTANEFLTSSLYLLRWLSYFLLIFVVADFDFKFKKLIKKFLLFAGFVIIILGYIQYIFLQSLKAYYFLGWDEHMFRMFSSLLDPNFASAIFTFIAIFMAGMIFQDKSNKSRLIKSVYLILLILSITAVYLSFSRSGLIMLISGSVVFLLLIKKLKFILILLLILSIFTAIFLPKFNIENINLFREASSKARIDNYSSAAGIFINQPLLGVGFNTYRYAKDKFGIQQGWAEKPSHADAGVDNSWLFVLVTTGFIGFITYLAIWIKFVSFSIRKINNNNNFWNLIFLSSFIGIFFHSQFINSLFYVHVMYWLSIIVGMILDKEQNIKRVN